MIMISQIHYVIHLYLHLGHLAGALVQSSLQQAHLSKERKPQHTVSPLPE